jgi:hypothetical protein
MSSRSLRRDVMEVEPSIMDNLHVAIYEPPRSGWPFVVVLKQGDECETFVARTRTQAREIALRFRSPMREPALASAQALA